MTIIVADNPTVNPINDRASVQTMINHLNKLPQLRQRYNVGLFLGNSFSDDSVFLLLQLGHFLAMINH